MELPSGYTSEQIVSANATEAKVTQPHHDGWELPKQLGRRMPRIEGFLDCDNWRFDLIKRAYRYGHKDTKLQELQKIEDIIGYLSEALPKTFHEIDPSFVANIDATIIRLFARSPGSCNDLFRLRVAIAHEAFFLGFGKPASQGIARLRQYCEDLAKLKQTESISSFVTLRD